jgi:hypothetical protein
MRVTAELHMQACPRPVREIRGHQAGGTAIEGEG